MAGLGAVQGVLGVDAGGAQETGHAAGPDEGNLLGLSGLAAAGTGSVAEEAIEGPDALEEEVGPAGRVVSGEGLLQEIHCVMARGSAGVEIEGWEGLQGMVRMGQGDAEAVDVGEEVGGADAGEVLGQMGGALDLGLGVGETASAAVGGVGGGL